MNAPLRKVGVVVLVLFALLFGNLNWVQGVRADEYRNSEYNDRVLRAEYDVERGKIIVGGQAIAQSTPTEGEYKYLRQYPNGVPYAHIVGYKSLVLGSAGIEKLESEYLSGNAPSQITDRISEMFTGEKPGGNVVLSISKAAQETAYNELVNNKNKVPKASAVAIDPKTGGILAAVSIPSFDPNTVVTHNRKAAQTAKEKLSGDDDLKPLRNRAFSERQEPGSTFKVIMAAAMLANGETPNSVLPAGPAYAPPQTGGFEIRNAAPSICPEATTTLIQALTESCNTAFARYGAERLGADKMKDMARKFGFESAPTIDRDDKNTCFLVAASTTGTMQNPENGKENPAFVAQSAIGQKDVEMTPLQGALVAATVANDGRQMRPYLVQELKGSDLTTINYTASPKELRQPITGGQAGDLQQMMISVVERGSGKNARISGFQVGGKTGTAENGAESHGWFIGFAMKGNEPVIATAVLLENAGKGGSAEAARITGQIMKAYVAEKGLG